LTAGGNFNISGKQKRVLVAPLNWGLGHATRCIPLIRALSANGCEVVLAAPTELAALLRQEFPQLELIPLEGYTIRYTRHPFWLPFRLLLQVPRLLRTIGRERRWLQKTIARHRLDAVISDNRFGLYSPQVPCIYITHQLAISTGWRLTDWLAQRWHYRFINRYGQCWVPDGPAPPGLAGRLSHPARLPAVPVQYLGPLSRFSPTVGLPQRYDLLLLLSGPEPQRSLLEAKLLAQVAGYQGNVLLVRGLPGQGLPLPAVPPHVQVAHHLPAAELALALQQSRQIVCRSGYTTLMDLVHLGKTALLVPTPGQTEQEYLGHSLHRRGLFYCVAQNQLNLLEHLPLAAKMPMPTDSVSTPAYPSIVQAWVKSL
jgi:UDP:flavonoid glycosyltransferase YjiC (YdhE family)